MEAIYSIKPIRSQVLFFLISVTHREWKTGIHSNYNFISEMNILYLKSSSSLFYTQVEQLFLNIENAIENRDHTELHFSRTLYAIFFFRHVRTIFIYLNSK